MDEQTKGPAPRHAIEALDASIEDIAQGRLHDALSTQAEARRILAEHESGRATASVQRRNKKARRRRSNS